MHGSELACVDRNVAEWPSVRAHCRSNVASKAKVRLITKLKNQSAFTQIAWFGEEKEGGEGGRELEILGRFGSATV